MAAEQYLRRFAVQMAAVCAALSLLPYVFGLLGTPSGATYLGFQYNTDDHMVYAAWMRQAMDGQFLFDNRFTVDSQPGLTLHLLFLVMGWIAKIFGIALTCALAKAAFTYWFVILLGRLVEKLTTNVFTGRLAIGLALVGGSFGFLVWHDFGQALVRPESQWLSSLMLGRLPTDVWQPEGYVVPSLLTNALFMASLCLIMGIFLAVLRARDSKRAIVPGLICFGLLMNIHSYDVLLIGLVLVAFAAVSYFEKQFTAPWITRVAIMAVGAVPFALWFVYVLRNDPVFQARAATPTFAPNFRQVAAGYVLLIVPAFCGWLTRDQSKRVRLSAVAAAAILVIGFLVATGSPDGYWLSLPIWIVAYAATVAICVQLRHDSPALNLVQCWALVGIVAPYFPALFQRKLAMGLSIPWGILAAIGIATVIQSRERNARNLVTFLVVIFFSATGLRWLFRERVLVQTNTSNTTVHPVYLNSDMAQILGYLNKVEGRRVVIAMPGVPNPLNEPDRFATPYVPDLNPILSGMTGAYTYAGHWSETPDYLTRRNASLKIFLRSTPEGDRTTTLKEAQANFLVAPVPEAFPSLQAELADLTKLGEVVVNGAQFRLIRLSP